MSTSPTQGPSGSQAALTRPKRQEAIQGDTYLEGILREQIRAEQHNRTHSHVKRFVIVGITVEEFLYGPNPFDFSKLEDNFKKICNDYGDLITKDSMSSMRSVRFCMNMIYEVGPQSRRMKKSSDHTFWKFEFTYGDNDNIDARWLYVTTFKPKGAGRTNRYSELLSMAVTDEQAGLLATKVFCDLAACALGWTEPIIFLTPLAKAVFEKSAIESISQVSGWSLAETIKKVNASCQIGSHCFDERIVSTEIAIITAFCGTRNLRDIKRRHSILSETVKKYINNNHTYDKALMMEIFKYAIGGLPEGFDPDTLVGDIERDTIKKMAISRALKDNTQDRALEEIDRRMESASISSDEAEDKKAEMYKVLKELMDERRNLEDGKGVSTSEDPNKQKGCGEPGGSGM